METRGNRVGDERCGRGKRVGGQTRARALPRGDELLLSRGMSTQFTVDITRSFGRYAHSICHSPHNKSFF